MKVVRIFSEHPHSLPCLTACRTNETSLELKLSKVMAVMVQKMNVEIVWNFEPDTMAWWMPRYLYNQQGLKFIKVKAEPKTFRLWPWETFCQSTIIRHHATTIRMWSVIPRSKVIRCLHQGRSPKIVPTSRPQSAVLKFFLSFPITWNHVESRRITTITGPYRNWLPGNIKTDQRLSKLQLRSGQSMLILSSCRSTWQLCTTNG